MLGFLESPKKVKSKLINLQQDNHDKIKVSISEEDLEREVKIIKRWRKNAVERFYKLSSSEYDKIIEKLHLKGY